MIYNCANWADLPWTEVRPGVQIPGLSTVEEIDEAISFTKYAPGASGGCPLPSAPPDTAPRRSSAICRTPTRG